MVRVPIRSRSGNIALAVLGAIYAVTALIVLVFFVIDVWSAAAIVDRALQLCLVATVACGVWFVIIARENLGHDSRSVHHRGASSRAHR